MTPAEKARELFDLYLNVGMGDGWAKDCALIAVKEIKYTHYDSITVMWWEDVEREIKKL